LKCLQNLQLNPKLPFSEQIRLSNPEELQAQILPPRYLMQENLIGSKTIDLGCITTGFKDTDFDVEQTTHEEFRFSVDELPSVEELMKRTTLDKGQSAALMSALQRELALVQGPPGTGKSFVGIQLAKILCYNSL